jgi:hypothetical protein
MLIVCDTFDWEDYPVYVEPTQDVKEVYERRHGRNMQKVMEVYKLSADMDEQLAEDRCFRF